MLSEFMKQVMFVFEFKEKLKFYHYLNLHLRMEKLSEKKLEIKLC